MNTTETKSFRSFGWMVVILLLGITAVCRVLNCFYSITATDILYDAWVSTAIGYVLDFLSGLRYVMSFGAVLYAQWKWGLSAGNGMFVIGALCSFADMGSRFAIDFFSASIRGLEMVALLWLLLQFAYELVTLALCWITGRIFIQKRKMSDSVRKQRKYSMENAFRLSLLYVLILRLGLWLYDVIDFLRTYDQVQNYEYASMAGQLALVFVLYGGAAYLFAELTQWLFGKTHGRIPE
ncbi:MAG: hypothetical protein E7658_06450 [Ruminococcaceae bacterium]|nr:hypothetical protein [Oscillospiraceae bacterium]